MKKNISINISGIIFHIEEDGYERLKAYLESINRYFSTFEDSEEIIADIESRIAEIFLTHLKEGKQVITSNDVEQLMATMGSIRDFQTVEDPLEQPGPAHRDYEEKAHSHEQERTTGDETYARKKLYRDEKKKVLGGVAAGIANYFNIDPLWVRLLLVIILLDLFVTFSISSIILIGYIVCWIVIPGTIHPVEDKKIKRLYRDPDERVIGGVSSGLAAYFGADPILIRIIFILTLFLGGSGFIIYLVLWAIMPPARTLTEKMQMQGEPVTLSNIEQNIRKSLNVKDGEEGTLDKIILFPFRFIAAVFRGLGKVAGPFFLFLGELLRILLGVLLVVLGLSFFFTSLSLLAIISGLADPELFIYATDVRLDILLQSIPDVAGLALFAVTFVLSTLAIIGGLMLITKRSLIKPVIGWTLFVILIVSLITLAISVSVTVNDFRREGTVESTKNFELPQGTTLLRLGDNPSESFEEVELRLTGYNGDRIVLEQTFEARGRNNNVAEQNAGMIVYDVEMEDSVITFDQSFDYAEGALFRNQRVDLTLRIPREVPFVMDRELYRILDWNSGRYHQYTGEKVMFDSDGNLTCLSCSQPREAEPDSVNWDATTSGSDVSLDAFSDLEVSEGFTVRVRYGAEYQAELPEDLSANVGLDVRGDKLTISYTGGMRLNDDDVTERTSILITMPEELEQVRLKDGARVRLEGFDQDRMELNLENDSYLLLDGNVEYLRIEQTGNSKVTLKGSGRTLKADLFSNTLLQALDYPCEEGRIEASGSSKAILHITDKLDAEASGNSEIRYQGECSLNSEAYGSATIRKYE
ncbi:MAG: PspC domain-containing protein [Cyclobacteriaceae bacterium]